jgi:hypothetical protein
MRLQWAGASGTTMAVYRNNVRIDTTPNTGRYTNTRRYSGRATYTYKVCVTGTGRCSNLATARF